MGSKSLLKYWVRCSLVLFVSWWLGYFFLTKSSVTDRIVKSVIFALCFGFLWTFWEVLYSKKKNE
jgi:hypothetical protein